MVLCVAIRSPLFYLRLLCACVLFAFVATVHMQTARSQSILTYHSDNLRTGWNSSETTLTPQNVSGLQLLTSVSLDEQVDAQPLSVPGLTIAGAHNVVYVVTENDKV